MLLHWLWLSTLLLGALWLFYYLGLRREQSFRYNRVLLVLAPLLAATLPLLPLPALELASPVAVQRPLQFLLPEATAHAEASHPAATAVPWLVLCYGVGVALLLSRLGGQLWQLWRFARSLPAEQHEDYMLRRTSGRRPTSSFGRTVFWDDSLPLTSAEGRQILAHELAHVRQRHTLDRLWLRVWQAVLWPNPFVHLLPPALHLTHEYLADEAAAATSPAHYVGLLAQQATRWLGQAPTLAHSFFSSSTLTRIAMLNRPSVTRRWKQWLALPLGCVLLGVVACEKNTPAIEAMAPQGQTDKIISMQQKSKESGGFAWHKVDGKEDKYILFIAGKRIGDELTIDEVKSAIKNHPREDDKQASSMPMPPPPPPPVVTNAKGEIIYTYVEQMPEYPGGISALLQHISENIQYPASAKAAKLEGRSFVNFTITKDGNIEDVYLRKGISSPEHEAAAQAMNEEAMRVVKNLPRWTPGQQDGQPVNVSFTVPISYALKK